MAHKTEKIELAWQDIYDIMSKMSSYEGRNAVTPSGDSDYPSVHITEQDGYAVTLSILHGAQAVMSEVGNLAYSVESDFGASSDDVLTIETVYDDSRRTSSLLKKMFAEAIASYGMMEWVMERKSTRLEFYTNLYTQMVNNIKKTMSKKTRPSLDIYESDEES